MPERFLQHNDTDSLEVDKSASHQSTLIQAFPANVKHSYLSFPHPLPVVHTRGHHKLKHGPLHI